MVGSNAGRIHAFCKNILSHPATVQPHDLGTSTDSNERTERGRGRFLDEPPTPSLKRGAWGRISSLQTGVPEFSSGWEISADLPMTVVPPRGGLRHCRPRLESLCVWVL